MPLTHPSHPQDHSTGDVAVNPVFTREPVVRPISASMADQWPRLTCALWWSPFSIRSTNPRA